MEQLPSELMRHVASYLPERDVRRLREVSRRTRHVLPSMPYKMSIRDALTALWVTSHGYSAEEKDLAQSQLEDIYGADLLDETFPVDYVDLELYTPSEGMQTYSIEDSPTWEEILATIDDLGLDIHHLQPPWHGLFSVRKIGENQMVIHIGTVYER